MSQKKSNRNGGSRFNVFVPVKALTRFVFLSSVRVRGYTNGWRVILPTIPVGLKKSLGGHKITRRTPPWKLNKR